MCEKFEWCDLHTTDGDLPGDHRKKLGYGIEFYYSEAENETYLNWMPDWQEWILKQGEVSKEIRGLRTLLLHLDDDFNNLVRQVTGQVLEAPQQHYAVACENTACVQETHEWLRGERTEACSLEPIESPEAWFSVQGEHSPERDEWFVWVDAAWLPSGCQAGIAVASLADAVERMQAECDRLNESGGDH